MALCKFYWYGMVMNDSIFASIDYYHCEMKIIIAHDLLLTPSVFSYLKYDVIYYSPGQPILSFLPFLIY